MVVTIRYAAIGSMIWHRPGTLVASMLHPWGRERMLSVSAETRRARPLVLWC